MAQVPNYYYNSPWIADAAKSLASALAPPDPEKMLAARKMQWEMDRGQKIATMEDETYAGKKEANEYLAKVLDLTANPIKNPLTGLIDREETQRQVIENFGKAVGKGGADYVDPGMKSAGPAAPTFAVSQAMASQRGQIQANNIMQQIAGSLAGITLGQQGQDRRQLAGFGHDEDMAGIQFENRMKLLAAEQEGNLKEIQARAKSAGGNPLTISGTVLNDITRLMWQRVQESGAEMDKRDFSELVARAGILTSQGRNAPTAVIEAYNKHVNEDEIQVDDGGFWHGERRTIKPHFDDAIGFGTVLAPGGAAPTAAPAASTPPPINPKTGKPFQEGETATSKTGKTMIWESGRFVYP